MARFREVVSRLVGKKKSRAASPPAGVPVLRRPDGRLFVLPTNPAQGEFTIGRAMEAEVRLENDLVSRIHAQARWQDGQLLLSDVSAHGTSINGKALRPETWETVPLGARLRFGPASQSEEYEFLCTESFRFLGKPAFLNQEGLLAYWPDGESTMQVGRSLSNALTLEAAAVSRSHAALSFQGQQLQVRDLASQHGTFLNDERLAPGSWRALADRDRIRFGDLASTLTVLDLGRYGSDAPLWEQRLHLDSKRTVRVATLANGQMRISEVVHQCREPRAWTALPDGQVEVPARPGSLWMVEGKACLFLGQDENGQQFGHSFTLTSEEYAAFAASCLEAGMGRR